MKTPEQIRKEKNKSLVDRFKNGESLQLMPVESTFFPPRKIIEKNKKDMEKVYNNKSEN